MLQRGDPNLRIEGDVVLAEEIRGGTAWRGLRLDSGSSFRIPDARRFITFRDFADDIGWFVDVPEGLAFKIAVIAHGTNEILQSATYGGNFQPLMVPWPRRAPGKIDIVAECVGTEPPTSRWFRQPPRRYAFVANHRALSRQWLIDACVGRGLEIGPGPQPQIMPSDRCDVSYLEQRSPEDWDRLYNKGGRYSVRPELWDNFVLGEASDLPVEGGSLDFIFANHVFEHFANPIGHLERWLGKLAPSGKVVCVVPDLHGMKDSIQERSTLAEWLDEYRCDVWEPTVEHYARFFQRGREDEQVKRAVRNRDSIHAHFYDNVNCRVLLEYAVRNLGYADFVIEHTRNHKDFHFVLRAAEGACQKASH